MSVLGDAIQRRDSQFRMGQGASHHVDRIRTCRWRQRWWRGYCSAVQSILLAHPRGFGTQGSDRRNDTRAFTEKAATAHSGQERVPVIEDGGRVLADSWKIANYLEEAYPDRTSLFGGAAGEAMARFFNNWADLVQIPSIARLRRSRYPWIISTPATGTTFARPAKSASESRWMIFAPIAKNASRVFGNSLEPLRQTLQAQPFFGGEAPLYPDYIVFGGFQWARAISSFALLENADPIAKWRERMLDTFNGLARKSPAY